MLLDTSTPDVVWVVRERKKLFQQKEACWFVDVVGKKIE